ncbi:MAG: hypothetical protein HFH49_12830 [Lachnospiraceae bacterium]|nr:hypothetical protein [Lachnospiraceae bacterium]
MAELDAIQPLSIVEGSPANPVHHCTKRDDGSDTTDWSYVYFGSYPQTEVTGDALTTAITGAPYDGNGDAWVDGVKYRRISKSDTNYDVHFGDAQYRYFKWEQIKWRVLKNDGNTLFLLADKGLDCEDYHDNGGSITWENCTLRSWLNNEFYGTAFSDCEQAAIVVQDVVNEDNPHYATEGGNDTRDNVYLMSIGETTNPEYGFCEDDITYSVSRRIQASDYAHARGGDIAGGTYNSRWWLRSPGNETYYAATVINNGDINKVGTSVYMYYYVCVPALHLNLSSDLWSMADDGTSGEGGNGGTSGEENSGNGGEGGNGGNGGANGEVENNVTITIDQKANDLEGCTIALSGTLTLAESAEASEANLSAAIDSLKFESSDDSKAKVLACNAVKSPDHRSATLEIWTTLYNEGEATITAKTPDGHTSECKVTIQTDTSEDSENYEGDYTTEMCDFLNNKGTHNTLKYLCNSSNFTASTFVAEKDAKFGNLLAMALTDTYYRGWDGWKDLINGSTSVEEAEKIIASLLNDYQSEVEALSKAKTAQKYAKMINNAFLDYTKSTNMFTALNSEEIQVVRQYFSDGNLTKLLYEGKYDEIVSPVNQILQQSGMNQIMQKSEVFQAGTEASKSWNKMMESFTQSAEASEVLKKGCQSKVAGLKIGGGLSDLGTALEAVSLSKDALDYIYQLETLLTADEMYSEMLLYVKENCAYSVVQEAAGNLYSVINDGAKGIMEDFKRFAADKLGEQALDLILQAAGEKSLIFTIIKGGFDWGVTISNTFFKVGAAQELKDSLRTQAFLANTLGGWALSKETEYLSAIGTGDEALKAKELYYSLYMTWESRKCAEETLQSLLKTTGGEWSANYSVSTKISSTLKSFKNNIFSEGNMAGLFGISVSCPVDVEVYNGSGTKLLAVKDGAECQGYEKGIYYYCIYNPLSDDYDKYIYYSEDAGYRVKIIGNDLGLADCSVSNVTDKGTVSEFYFENRKVDKGTVITLDGISQEGVAYKVTDVNGGETSHSMDSRKADKISTLSISLNANSLKLAVGEKQLLTVSFAPANASNQKVVWSSSDDAVASVNSDGVITAKKAGTAEITVSQGDLSQICKITVKKQNAEYKIDYNLNGGTVSGNPTSYTADILPITLKNPIRNGYDFTGWTGSNGSMPQKTVVLSKGSSGNKSFTANWSKNQSTETGVGSIGTGNESAKTSIKSAKISLKKTSYVYNGKKKQPSVTVKVGSKTLKKGTDYKVTYKNNKKVGSASVVISGIGKYTGKVTKKFKIVPKGTFLSKVTGKSKGFTASWKKQAKSTDGYQIQYSTSKKFTKKTTKTKTVKKASARKLTIKKLKAQKKYYVRIRTYKTVKGKKYYSSWSKSRSVKTGK